MPAKKTNPKPTTKVEERLAIEVKELTKEVRKLKKLEFVKVMKSPWKFMGFMFLKGLMVGFGSILGASVLVALFISILAQISFVPILGDIVQDVMGQIEITKPSDDSTDSNFLEQYNEAIQPESSESATTSTDSPESDSIE